MTPQEIDSENKWLAENGLPSLDELWSKLNDHTPPVKMVKASEFFITPEKFYQMMLQKFGNIKKR